MKTLLTGAAGFLGSAVLKRMLIRGSRRIRVLVRSDEGAKKVETSVGPSRKDLVEIMLGDYTVPEDAERALTGVERLIHIAAVLKGTSSNMFHNNVVGSKVILETIHRLGSCKNVLLVSSLGVYGVFGLPRNAKIDESVPADRYPERRDLYTHTKIWQEELFRDQQYAGDEKKFNLCIVRPGPIYGPGGSVLPARIGLSAPFLFLNFGNRNRIPLTYVENCAEAIAFLAGKYLEGTEVFNVIDPNVPTSRQYLKRYRKYVGKFRYVSVPFSALKLCSKLVEGYSRWSEGQLPPFLTEYKTENMWKPLRYDNSKIMRAGWVPIVSTEEALEKTMTAL